LSLYAGRNGTADRDEDDDDIFAECGLLGIGMGRGAGGRGRGRWSRRVEEGHAQEVGGSDDDEEQDVQQSGFDGSWFHDEDCPLGLSNMKS
jgi:hypothetical protein